ncbi:hypothetical protein ACIGMX_34360 [Streptomyces aquilus]|uniref:hypothetical protein n=1 Tax=Streptomyces aquilus TaxID=2548456 RepID=UPI0037D47BDB
MAVSARSRIPTRKELAEEEYRIDQVRGRRRCPVHRSQQMIPLLAGVDVCPACGPEDSPETRQPESTDLG